MMFFSKKHSRYLTIGILLVIAPVVLWLNDMKCKILSYVDRYDELTCIVNKNTGVYHFVRGMNEHTVNALKNEVTETDIPILRRMTMDKDRIVIMTAFEVLKEMELDSRIAALVTALNTSDSDSTITDVVLSNPAEIEAWKQEITYLTKVVISKEYSVKTMAIRILNALGDQGNSALNKIYSSNVDADIKKLIKESLAIRAQKIEETGENNAAKHN